MTPAVILINSLGTGGAERAVALAAAGLRARSRDVRVLCLERIVSGEIPIPGLEIEYLSGMRASSSSLLKLAAIPVLALRLASWLSRHDAGVVMSHLFRANFVNVLARVIAGARHRVVVVNHTRISRLRREGLQGRINAMLCRLLYPKADLVASVSSAAAAECAKLLDLPDGKSITLYDPIDTGAAAAVVRQAAAGNGAARQADAADAIVCSGRLVSLKRFDDLIAAFSRVAPDFPRLHLRVVGDGPERQRLERAAAVSGFADRITFLGRVGDPLAAMTGAAAFVSTSETEGFGMAIVEALALGIPVAAADCAYGPREILAPDSDPACLLDAAAAMQVARFGILFPVGALAELEKALRKLLGDASLRSELSRTGPLRAADFSADRAVTAYDRILDARNNRIVLSSNTCWYVYNFRLSLIRALLAGGWRVTVLAPRDEYTDRIIATGAEHFDLALDARGTSPLHELAAIRRFKSAYAALRPAAALHHTIKPDIYGSIAARSLGIPVINTITGLGMMFSGGVKELFARFLYRFAFSRARLVFFQNRDDLALFLKARIVRRERSALLPGSGVDTQRFSPRPRGDGPFTFLFAARLLRAKGVEDFIEAARRVRTHFPATRFVLLGRHDPQNPEYADSAKLSAAVADNVVRIEGHVDDIRPLVAASDCVVLPSYYREGVPRSLLEAASMGKPLIAADSIGTREPMQDGVNGFLCRPRDPVDLADKMEAMIALTPQERSAMGAASRRLMTDRFDEKLVIAAYLEAVDRLAGARAAAVHG